MIEIEFLIPYYGDRTYLLAAVQRVRALRDTRWQLTIVEDHDPDGAAAQRDVEALGDRRIRYVRNETNLGPNANTFRCIQLAEWDWFAMPGHDDLLEPNYGQAVAELLHGHPDAAIVQPNVEIIDAAGRPYLSLADRVKSRIGPGGRRETVLHGESGAASLLRGNWLYTPACCYRRDALQRVPFREGIDAAHDLAFVIDVLLDGGEVVTGTRTAFQYRRHTGSHSSSLARTGVRFEQERRYFSTIAVECAARGWTVAERAAKLRLTSRLNALSQTIHARDAATVTMLLNHAIR